MAYLLLLGSTLLLMLIWVILVRHLRDAETFRDHAFDNREPALPTGWMKGRYVGRAAPLVLMSFNAGLALYQRLVLGC